MINILHSGKSIFLLTNLALALCMFPSLAQEKESKVKVKITKEVDGQTHQFEKEYSSQQEMENDPELRAFNEKIGNSDNYLFHHSNGKFDMDYDFDLDIADLPVMEEFDMDFDVDLENEHFFHFESDSFPNFFMHHPGEDFLVHVIGDSAFKELEIKIKEEIEPLMREKDSIVRETLRVYRFNDRNVKVNRNVNVLKRRVTISEPKGESQNNLQLKRFKTFPNPSDGNFTLEFQAAKAPLELKILDSEGTTVYAEKLNDFTGSYKKELKLSHFQKDTYILQILQNKKMLSRRILIE